MKKLLSIFIYSFLSGSTFSQTFYSEGASIYVSNGGVLHSNGGVTLSNATQFTNQGSVTVTKNSTFSQSGTFEMNTNSLVSGDGTYEVEQDWINDALFNGGASEVILYGNTEQFITSNTGTVTNFNNLTLTGSGTNTDRRKTLRNVDATTGLSGVLTINDRELNTNIYSFFVNNPSPNAVTNSTTFNDEGFVSSLTNGFFVRKTNQQVDYLFPVGSSDGVRRYRPIEMNPNEIAEQQFEARLNNYSADNDSYFLAQHENSIDQANSLFYHSINRRSGTANPDIKMFFIPTDDGDWKSFAHWYDGTEQEWKDVTNTTENNGTNFKYLYKNAWNFPTNEYQYTLINTTHTFKIPESFSPNNNGVNEYFYIENLELFPNSLIWIYNRWGTEVYQSNNYQNDWDGRSQSKYNVAGDELPEGTYYYIFQLGGVEGQEGFGEIHKGFVYLKK